MSTHAYELTLILGFMATCVGLFWLSEHYRAAGRHRVAPAVREITVEGPQGRRGKRGKRGKPGITGPTGISGVTGSRGPRGYSAESFIPVKFVRKGHEILDQEHFHPVREFTRTPAKESSVDSPFTYELLIADFEIGADRRLEFRDGETEVCVRATR